MRPLSLLPPLLCLAGAAAQWTTLPATRCLNDAGQTDGVASPEACQALCAARAGCDLYSFCPTLGAGGCPVAGGCWYYPLRELPNCEKNQASWTSGWRPAPSPPPPVPPPAAWLPRIAAGDMLYAARDDDVLPEHMPMVGNGFLATQVSSTDVWVSGLFNGYQTVGPSHRARVPSTIAVAAPGQPGPAALDVREATYYRRSYLDPSPPGTCTAASTASCSNAPARIWIEQRLYAHRAIPSLLVMEVQVVPDAADAAPAAAAAAAAQAAPFAMLALSNKAGGPSADVGFAPVPLPPDAPYTIVNGSTHIAESNTSGLQAVALLTSLLPAVLAVPAADPHATFAFLTVARTSIETPPGGLVAAVQADFATAAALAAAGTLHAAHIAEWAATVWPAGFGTDRGDVARAVNTSIYAILSSVRNDRPYGLSPGGLTSGYNGHSFWDCETWMLPPINLLHPDTAASLISYRLARQAGARDKASSYSPPFGGAMFPWESALTGEETCPSWAPTGLREIHINGDIAAAVWSFWRATQDESGGWLAQTAWPLLSGIAEFWMVRKFSLDPIVPSSPAILTQALPRHEPLSR